MHLIPFNETWAGSETKLDLKGIYARRDDPRTLSSPLPLRRHLDWTRKGWVFVSLSSLEELGTVAGSLRNDGLDPLAMRECFTRHGDFDVTRYLRELDSILAARDADLQAKVDKYGPEAVTEMLRVSDPTFTLPSTIRLTSPSAAVPEASVTSAGTVDHPPAPKAMKAKPSAPKGDLDADSAIVGGFKG